MNAFAASVVTVFSQWYARGKSHLAPPPDLDKYSRRGCVRVHTMFLVPAKPRRHVGKCADSAL
eukprot:260819-Prorocentrum_lima.AAC.1